MLNMWYVVQMIPNMPDKCAYVLNMCIMCAFTYSCVILMNYETIEFELYFLWIILF